MQDNILTTFKWTKVSNGAAAGTGTGTGSTLAMDGFDSVLFLADLGAVVDSAVAQLTAQDGALSNGSDAANITDAGNNTVQVNITASGSSNGALMLDVHRPLSRYVTPILGRTLGNITVNSIWAVQYNAGKNVTIPIAQPAASVLKSGTFLAAT